MPVAVVTPWVEVDPDETAGKLRRSQLAAQQLMHQTVQVEVSVHTDHMR